MGEQVDSDTTNKVVAGVLASDYDPIYDSVHYILYIQQASHMFFGEQLNTQTLSNINKFKRIYNIVLSIPSD